MPRNSPFWKTHPMPAIFFKHCYLKWRPYRSPSQSYLRRLTNHTNVCLKRNSFPMWLQQERQTPLQAFRRAQIYRKWRMKTTGQNCQFCQNYPTQWKHWRNSLWQILARMIGNVRDQSSHPWPVWQAQRFSVLLQKELGVGASGLWKWSPSQPAKRLFTCFISMKRLVSSLFGSDEDCAFAQQEFIKKAPTDIVGIIGCRLIKS